MGANLGDSRRVGRPGSCRVVCPRVGHGGAAPRFGCSHPRPTHTALDTAELDDRVRRTPFRRSWFARLLHRVPMTLTVAAPDPERVGDGPRESQHRKESNHTDKETSMSKSKTRVTTKDAIALLKADHQKMRALLGELEKTTGKATARREELLEEIERELKIHTTVEEQIFYPAFRTAVEKKDDRKLYFEALEE